MLLQCVRVDHDIVEVDKARAPAKTRQDEVHGPLESSGSIREAEGHHFKLEEAICRDESRFFTVGVFQGYLVVSRLKVHNGEVRRPFQATESVGDPWQGISVFYCYVVEAAVVHTEAPVTILLFYEDDGSAPGAVGVFDNPFSQHPVDLLLHDFPFFPGTFVGGLVYWLSEASVYAVFGDIAFT